jgi:flagellin
MALGVLNNLSAIYAENNLNNTSNSLQTVLQQLSSGSRINSGADDAAGLALIKGLQANSTALTQSSTNAVEGVGLLKVADGALSQVTNLLNRAITLATEAANGTLNSSQMSAANQEYQSILAEINNIGSTTTYNQEQVFSGSTTSIYTGDSSTTGSSIDNLYIRTLSSSSVGDSGGSITYSSGQNNVFIDLSIGGNNAAVTDTLNGGATGSTTITVNYVTKSSNGAATLATAQITVGTGTNYDNTAQGLIDAINNAGLGLSATFTTAQTAGTSAVAAAKAANTAGGGATDTGIMISGVGVGTGTNGAGEIGSLTVANPSDTLGGSLTIVGSDNKSHTITLGTAYATDTLANLAATINAANYGVTATVNTSIVDGNAVGTVLTLTSAYSTVSVTGSNLTDAGVSTALQDVPLAAGSSFSSTIGTISGMTAGATFTGGTLTVGSNAAFALTGLTLAGLATAINNGNYGVTATVNTAGTAISFTSSNSADTFSVNGVTVSAGTYTATTAVPNHAQIGAITVGGTGWASTDVMTGSTITFGSNTFAIPAGTTYANLASVVNAANIGVTASYDSTTGQLTFVSNDVSTQGVSFSASLVDVTHGTATFTATADTPSTANTTYYSVGISGSITDSSTGGGTLNIGMVTNSDGAAGVASINYTDNAGANLSSTDLTTSANAQLALSAINEAISDVAAMDGYIGGQINLLTAIGQVLSTQQTNVVSAQDAIQATDYAAAASNLSKYTILTQTGIAALAQANSVQKEVTKLLQ